MRLKSISKTLDNEFGIPDHPENLVEWAVTEETQEYINSDFLNHQTGLMTDSFDTITEVFSCVFVSDQVVKKLKQEKNVLLFTHHQFNYYEDERGLQPISPETFGILQDRGVSIFVAHAPLDTHPTYGTSISLAEFTGISIDKIFFDYFGAPTALFGHIERTPLFNFTERLRKTLARPCLTIQQHSPFVEKLAVVAGGGDEPDILKRANEEGCDTLLTGTVEHRWAAPFVQEKNKEFHDLNKEFKLNLIGGTHFGTERPAMIKVIELIERIGIKCEYCEDEHLLNAE
ncbi:MAG: transcriptional regulator [Candidatus Aegiribacteria sp.]|nr:transcriptional regulator [Candidatus Aegiribacteria sp.]